MVKGTVVRHINGWLGHVIGPALVNGAVVVVLDEEPGAAKVARVADLHVLCPISWARERDGQRGEQA